MADILSTTKMEDSMILWMSHEIDKNIDGRSLRTIRNSIEKQINTHLKAINYQNEKLKNWDIIITLRDDDVFNEIIKYSKKNKDTDFHLKINYNSFKNGDDKQRRKLIYDLLDRSLDILEEKGIDKLEPVRDIITRSRYENIDEHIAYYESIQVKE